MKALPDGRGLYPAKKIRPRREPCPLAARWHSQRCYQTCSRLPLASKDQPASANCLPFSDWSNDRSATLQSLSCNRRRRMTTVLVCCTPPKERLAKSEGCLTCLSYILATHLLQRIS